MLREEPHVVRKTCKVLREEGDLASRLANFIAKSAAASRKLDKVHGAPGTTVRRSQMFPGFREFEGTLEMLSGFKTYEAESPRSHSLLHVVSREDQIHMMPVTNGYRACKMDRVEGFDNGGHGF